MNDETITGRDLIKYILDHRMENSTMVLRKPPGHDHTGSAWFHITPALITNGNGIMIFEHPCVKDEEK